MMRNFKKTLLIGMMIVSQFSFAQNNNVKEEIKIQTSAQCEMCKERIENALNSEKGVISSTLDLSTKYVSVVYKPNKTNPDKIRVVITKLGYQADEFIADPIAYDKLPSCCKLPKDVRSK